MPRDVFRVDVFQVFTNHGRMMMIFLNKKQCQCTVFIRYMCSVYVCRAGGLMVGRLRTAGWRVRRVKCGDGVEELVRGLICGRLSRRVSTVAVRRTSTVKAKRRRSRRVAAAGAASGCGWTFDVSKMNGRRTHRCLGGIT